jgi:hypothetical protein
MNKHDEQTVMAEIHKYSLITENLLEDLENLIKKGYSFNSPEIKVLREKLHEAEVQSNYWRKEMIQFL